jgi:homoserine O-acetyltransferase
MDYDPSPNLQRILAPLLAINFADDELNPPQLDALEPAMSRLRNGRFVVVPAGPQSDGHYTTLRASEWKAHLETFMREQLTST